jgi:hypothetical protein
LAKIRHANEYYGWGWGIGKGCNGVLETVELEETNRKMREWIGKTCPCCNEKIEEDTITDETGR